MTFDDTLKVLEKWASLNRTDCQLAGAYDQADNFQMVLSIVELVRSQRALITKHDEIHRAHEAEIARLSTLVHQR